MTASDPNSLASLLCAHRGYHNPRDDSDPTRFLENTLPAYERGWELLDFAECDVQLSRDGEVVLVHDTCLARVAEITHGLEGEELEASASALGLDLEDLQVLVEAEGCALASALVRPSLARLWERSLLNELKYQALPPHEQKQVQILLAHCAVRELSLLQLNRVPLKRAARVPRLEELLELLLEPRFESKQLVIELKTGDPEVVDPVLELIERRECWNRVFLMSFDADVMRAAHQRWHQGSYGELRTFWLVCSHFYEELGENSEGYLDSPERVGELIHRLKDIGVGGVYLEYNPDVTTAEVLLAFKDAGLELGIWSGKAEIERGEVVEMLGECGAMVINTDEPEFLLKELGVKGKKW